MSHSFFHTAPPMLPFYSEDVRNARRRTIFFEAKATLLCVQRVDRRICLGGSPNYFCLLGESKISQAYCLWQKQRLSVPPDEDGRGLSEPTNCRKPASIISKSAVIPLCRYWSTICMLLAHDA